MDSYDQEFYERLLSKTEIVSGCRKWLGNKDKDGYGLVKYRGKSVRTHRIMFILHYGRIRKGNVILHSCDNRFCINPKHLSAGSHKKNMKDMKIKSRSTKGKSRKTFDKHEVILIRALAWAGVASTTIAHRFSNRPGTIQDIISGKSRRSVVTRFDKFRDLSDSERQRYRELLSKKFTIVKKSVL